MAGFDTIENALDNVESVPEAAAYICETLTENINNERNILSYFKKRLLCTLPKTDFTVHLLWVVMPRFSKDAVDENIVNWIELVLKQEVNNPGDVFNFLKCTVEYCGKSHDRHRSAVSALVPSLLNKCFSLKKSSFEVQSLNLMKTCFTYFPSASGPYKAKAEKFVLRYLDMPSRNTAIGNIAAKCFVPILQSGPSGIGSINHQENWTKAFNMLCVTMMNIHDHLLSTGYIVLNIPNTYHFDPLPDDCTVYKSFSIAQNRLHWLCQFLKEMIRMSYRTPKVFKPQQMLNVLENALLNQYEPPGKSVAVNSIRMQYKKDICDLLRYFVVMMGGNMMMFSDFLMRNLIAELNKLRNQADNDSSSLKCSLYDLLSTIIATLGNNVGVTYQEKLVNAILEDITPPKENMQLSMPSSTLKGAKNRQKFTNDQTIANSNKSISDGSSVVKGKMDKIYISAVQCLTQCMTYLSMELKPDLQKKLYGIILSITKSIENGTTHLPCTDRKNHHVIYKLLSKCVEQIQHVPLPHLVSALNAGSRNGSSHIHKTITKGLKRMRDICLPSQAPLVSGGASAFTGNVVTTREDLNESSILNNSSDEEEDEGNVCTVSDKNVDDNVKRRKLVTSIMSDKSSEIFSSQHTSEDKMLESEENDEDIDEVDVRNEILMDTNSEKDRQVELLTANTDGETVSCSEPSIDDMLASFVP